jgi:predicted dehydrogenase
MPGDARGLSRRQCLYGAGAVAAAVALPAWFEEETRSVAQTPEPNSANDRPGILLVGCGGQGTGDAKLASRFGDVVAICDVDDRHVANAGEAFPKAKQFRDFRQAIAHPGVDVVVNGTPDHWHTLVNIHAMRQGKDVYGEKPLTLTIDEGKHLVEAYRKSKRIFQTGSQQRSDRRFRLACELVRNERIGKLKHVLVALPSGPRAGPFSASPVPEGLDWDTWQGQTKPVDYVRQRCHGTFRYWLDYSGGTITDWGAHHFDIAQWGIGTDRSGPVSVHGRELSSPIPGGYTTAADYWVEYEYANGVRLTCISTAADEGNGASRGTPRTGTLHNGVLFEGDSGWIWVTRGQISASDEALLSEPLPSGATRLYASDNHMGNFFECVKSRKETICDAEIGHRSVTLCHLGSTSIRLGRKLKWDPQKQQYVGDDEANGYLVREMRKPWGYDAV